MILAHTDVHSRIVHRTSLADDDVASLGKLATEDLQT